MKRLISFLLVLCLLAAIALAAVPVTLAATAESDVLSTLKALEILVGDGSGNLHLDADVSRAEFAKLLVATSKDKDAVGGQGMGYSLFTDVKSAHWASEYIKLCLDNGWMIGYTDGSFRPDNTVTLEEACTATLRLLGWDGNNLAGSFPAAQLNKASAVGLRDDVSAQRGDALKRRDCARIFYNLLTCKTAQGQVYATTLGWPLDADGQVDTLKLAKEDLSDPFIWAPGSALGFAPATVYYNDRLVEGYAPNVGDVCYTNRAQGILWVYTDQVFGQIGALAPSVGRPESVNVGGKNYALATDAVKAKLASLGDNAVGSVVTLYLGMDGAVADADAVNGPFVAGGYDKLPFTPQTVYRNGVLVASASLLGGDVYYYSAASQTLWVCTDQASGRIEALTPSAMSPTAVTVAGKSYTLGSEALSRELSTLNGKWVDQFVTLLLGMDGSVVRILSGDSVAADYYGVVQSVSKTAEDGAVEQRLGVFCTDGALHTFPVSPDRTWKVGDMVRVTVSGTGAEAVTMSASSVSGTVSKGGGRIGNTLIAADAQIIDVADDGAAAKVAPADLEGLSLSAGNVRYYTLNAAGAIDRLILKDTTGALWSYGFLADVESQGRDMNVTNRYTLWQNGQSRSVQASKKSFPVTRASGVALRMGTDGAVAAMQDLNAVKLTSLSRLTAYTASQSFAVAGDVQVYLKDKNGDYYAAELDDAVSGGFTLTGWYDPWQKTVRVILAQ